MLKPYTYKKMITMTEEEWLTIYFAAKQQGIDPVQFIKNSAVSAGNTIKHTAANCQVNQLST